MARKSQIRTCTVMIMADGKISNYAVMVGPMKGKAFNSHAADIVAIYKIEGTPNYNEMTAHHATDAAPAVYWQS